MTKYAVNKYLNHKCKSLHSYDIPFLTLRLLNHHLYIDKLSL